MINYFTGALLALVLVSCASNSADAYQFSDEDFQQILLEVELAKESANTASINLRDSFFQIYLDAIALKHETSAQAIVDEIHVRVTTQEDFVEIYERLIPLVDTMDHKPNLQ